MVRLMQKTRRDFLVKSWVLQSLSSSIQVLFTKVCDNDHLSRCYRKIYFNLEILFSENPLKVRVGELQSVDGYMNIALEDTKEYVDGKLRRNYGDAFVRGNNGEGTFLGLVSL